MLCFLPFRRYISQSLQSSEESAASDSGYDVPESRPQSKKALSLFQNSACSFALFPPYNLLKEAFI